MTFQNGGSHRKLFLDRRKRSQFDHTMARKAMLIYYAYVTSSGYINRLKKDAAFQEIHVFDHIFLIIVPLFRTLPGALFLAKLQHQLTIFSLGCRHFARLHWFAQFLNVTLKCHIVAIDKKHRQVCPQRFSPAIKFAAIGVQNRQVCRRLNVTFQ